jgi:hypothetical protein
MHTEGLLKPSELVPRLRKEDILFLGIHIVEPRITVGVECTTTPDNGVRPLTRRLYLCPPGHRGEF